MGEPVFTCPRCRRVVPLDGPRGEPLVTIQALRFHSAPNPDRADGALTFGPAGQTPPVRRCIRCADGAWDAIQQALGRDGERWPE